MQVIAAEPNPGDAVQGLRSLDDGFIPPVLDPTVLDRKILVTSDDSVAMTRRLADQEGKGLGPQRHADTQRLQEHMPLHALNGLIGHQHEQDVQEIEVLEPAHETDDFLDVSEGKEDGKKRCAEESKEQHPRAQWPGHRAPFPVSRAYVAHDAPTPEAWPGGLNHGSFVVACRDRDAAGAARYSAPCGELCLHHTLHVS